ncbi:MAG: hypothetical protein GY798_17620, partial [Hyphomicrobiales bacterium]|nr:hypothetical protein [Hyphomicrobiales bacterium]
SFARFGRVSTTEIVREGQRLLAVQVAITDSGINPQTVIAAASEAGLSGAFIVSR